jgi:hypothetical protein
MQSRMHGFDRRALHFNWRKQAAVQVNDAGCIVIFESPERLSEIFPAVDHRDEAIIASATAQSLMYSARHMRPGLFE